MKLTLERLPVGNAKKIKAVFQFADGTRETTQFGDQKYEDYTIHKDKERRARYIARHKHDLNTGNYTRAGYLSMYILWNKPTVAWSKMDFVRRIRQNDWSLPNSK